MARRSSAYSLRAELRDDLSAKWRSGQSSLDELHQLAGRKISRSALHRFLETSDRLYQDHCLLQEAANIWCAKMGEDLRSDVGRLCEEMLRVIAHSQIKRLHAEDRGPIALADVALLARTLKDIELAISIGDARENKLRERLAANLENKVEEARARGIDPKVLERAKLLVRGALDEANGQHRARPANHNDEHNSDHDQ
jgi:hypothetical protein